MKTIVTGANGFIGSHLVRHLLDSGHSVRALVRATSDQRSLEGLDVDLVYGDIHECDSLTAAFEGCDWCFHVAGVFRYGRPDAVQLAHFATSGMENVLIAARQTGVDRVVFTSSSVVWGASRDLLVIEETQPLLVSADTAYVSSKLQQHQHAFRLAKEWGMDVRAVCPTLTIGPQDFGLTESNRMLINYLRDPMKASWIGGCNLVSVVNIAQAHLLVAEQGTAGQAYLAGGDNLYWEEVHRMISALCGLPGPFMTVHHTSAYLAALGQEIWGKLTGAPPLSNREQARMVGRYYWYDSTLLRQLGYHPLPAQTALVQALAWLVNSPHLPMSVRSTLNLTDTFYQLSQNTSTHEL